MYIVLHVNRRRNRNNSKDPNNNYVLITTILHHQGYVTSEIVIGKNLMEIFNAGGIALLSNYNLKDYYNIILEYIENSCLIIQIYKFTSNN